MNIQENRKLWIAALRSGKYTQGKGSLCRRDDEGNEYHCCLGVLCEVAKIKKVFKGKYVVTYGVQGQKTAAPKEAVDFVGLSTSVGEFYGGALTTLNDSYVGFERIANLIEKEPEWLFEEKNHAKSN